jgi:hypothetical protein
MDRLAARRAAIREHINQLVAELKELDEAAAPDDASTRKAVRDAAHTRRQPLRQQVLDALDILGVAALSREIQAFVASVYGDEVEPTRFGSLRREELRSYDNSRPRSLYIAYGLTERGEAIKRLLCRSDWPLEERVVAPTTGRVQHLRMTLRLCEFALREHHAVARPQALEIMVADHARDLPGIKFSRGEFPFELWRDRAAALLDETLDRDRANRELIARRLRLHPDDRLLLFGTEKTAPDTRIDPPITQIGVGT